MAVLNQFVSFNFALGIWYEHEFVRVILMTCITRRHLIGDNVIEAFDLPRLNLLLLNDAGHVSPELHIF